MNKKELTVEEAFELLDGVVEKLEDQETPLEESFALYQKGMELLKLCNDKIDTVEKKMMQVNQNGELEEF